jgi:kumamolisin
VAIPPQTTGGVNAVDVVDHYRFPAAFNGSGQRIALIEIEGAFVPTELEIYCTLSGLPMPKVTDVPVGTLTDSSNPELAAVVSRDLELLAAAAPGAEILLYRVPNNEAGFVDGFIQAIMSGPEPPVVLCVPLVTDEAENPMLVQALEETLQDAAALGVTVCAASDPSLPFVPYPASSPYVLACGTTLASVAPDGSVVETIATGSPAASASRLFELPTQSGGRRRRARTLPDVTCASAESFGYRVFIQGEWFAVVGAEPSTCLWSGLVARLAQALGGRLGYLTPFLHDRLGPAGILRRPDGWGGAATGAGWGSPDGEALLAALRERT